jgi:4-hydroxy-tetrahydrodipicolinate reductase
MENEFLSVILCGKNGKMGQAILAATGELPQVEVIAAMDRRTPLSEVLGSLSDALLKQSVIVDFSHASLMSDHLNAARQYNIPAVLGCTGLDATARSAITSASEHIPIFYAPNFSTGACILKWLTTRASTLLPDADVVVSDIHHKEKKDSPSGTALALKAAICDPAAKNMPQNPVQMVSVRAGTVFGQHSVAWMLDGESVEITHKAESRKIFAIGALKAAYFVRGRPPGLYGMENMLGIG